MLTIVQMFPLDTYAAISFSSWMQSSAPCTTVTSSSGHPLDPGGWGWGVTGRGSLHGVGSRLHPIHSLGRGVTALRKASPKAGEPREQSEWCQCHLWPQPPGAPWVCCFGWPDTKRSVSRSVFQISFPWLTFRGGTKCRMGDSPGNQGLTPFWPVEPCWNALVYKHCFDTSDIWK